MPDTEQYERWVRLVPGRGWGTTAHMAAIEAEAVAAERERITRRIEVLHASGLIVPDEQGHVVGVSLAAVLAIVNPEADRA